MRLYLNRISLFVLLLAALILFHAASVCAQTRRPAPKDDTQEWNDVQITVPLNKRVDFLLLGTLRLGRNITHPVDERVGISFSYKVNQYVTLAPSLTLIQMQPTASQRSYEERLSIAVTFTLPKKNYTLSDRNTFEQRFRSPQVDATRYRNRLQLEYPYKLRSTTLTFVASDEVFYDWSLDNWVRNRFLVGVRRTFNKHFTADLY